MNTPIAQEPFHQMKCVPCEGGVKPLDAHQIAELQQNLQSEWHVNNGHLVRTYAFKDFAAALRFVNLVGDEAERHGHHPNVLIEYNKVTLELWTHAIDGLSVNDFILADTADVVMQHFAKNEAKRENA